MLSQLILLAQDSAPSGGGQTGSGPGGPNGAPGWWNIILFAPLFILLYFFMLRPRKGDDRKNFFESLKKNDKVLTASGIIGTVVSVSDTEDEVVVKIDDNTRVRMIKSSVIKNLSQEEAARAAKETPAKG